MEGGPKQARVYFRRDGKRVIVATVHHTPKGILVEAEGPLSLTSWNEEALGESLQTALEQSSIFTRELPGMEPAYWPALKVSGEPSARSFQVGFLRIDLFGVKPVILIDGTPEKDELRLRLQLRDDVPPAELARKATRMFEILRDRKF
jgi:hypothetical protein